MHLELSYTDQSGTTHPDAALVYSQLRLQTDPPYCEMVLTIYHDAESFAAGLAPVEPARLITFTQEEMGQIATQFGAVPLVVLQGRAEYSGAALVG
jgi:hypothetical protein